MIRDGVRTLLDGRLSVWMQKISKSLWYDERAMEVHDKMCYNEEMKMQSRPSSGKLTSRVCLFVACRRFQCLGCKCSRLAGTITEKSYQT